MTEYQIYINALRKCAKEHENDITSTGHIVVSALCQDTANLLESLKQEHILDKIRAEIEQTVYEEQNDEKWAIGLRYAIKIIDKYR